MKFQLNGSANVQSTFAIYLDREKNDFDFSHGKQCQAIL